MNRSSSWQRVVAAVALVVGTAACAPSPQSVCQKAGERVRRCDTTVPACRVADQERICTQQLALFRTDLLGPYEECINRFAMMCGSEADRQANDCVTNAVRNLQPSGPQRELITATCNACPTSGGMDSTDAATCISRLTAPIPAMPGTQDLAVVILRILGDQQVNQVRQCLAMRSPMDCTAVNTCFQMLNLSPDAGVSACADAGVDSGP